MSFAKLQPNPVSVEEDFRLTNLEQYWLQLSSYDLEKIRGRANRIGPAVRLRPEELETFYQNEKRDTITPRSRQVLLIEDSPIQAASVSRVLEAEGVKTHVASTIEEGLEYLRTAPTKPGLIVLDYYLAGITGAECCRLIKSNLENRFIPIVIYSMENRLKVIEECYLAGADYYVVKDGEAEGAEGYSLQLLITAAFIKLNRRRYTSI
jgi:CheY-like chemotaxis protein